MLVVELMFVIGGCLSSASDSGAPDDVLWLAFIANGMPGHMYLVEVSTAGEITTRHGIRAETSAETGVTFERLTAAKKTRLSSVQFAEVKELARVVAEEKLPPSNVQYLGGWQIEVRVRKQSISVHLADLEKQSSEFRRLVEAVRKYSPIPIELKSWS